LRRFSTPKAFRQGKKSPSPALLVRLPGRLAWRDGRLKHAGENSNTNKKDRSTNNGRKEKKRWGENYKKGGPGGGQRDSLKKESAGNVK